MKLATQWEDAARRRITEAQARRVISDIHEEIHGSPLASPSLADFKTQWLARKEKETEAVTYSVYKNAVDAFETFLGDKANQPLHYITPAKISAWRDHSATQATARTANNKLKILRGLFQTAWRDGLTTDNAAAKVQALKTAKSKRRPFTLPELKAVLGVASKEWQGMILVAFYTGGTRLKDIALLTVANVDTERDVIRFNTSKTDRTQIIPMAEPLRDFLTEFLKGDDPKAPLFPSAYRVASEHLHTGMLSRQFHEILVLAGLAQARPKAHVSSGKGRRAPRERNALSFHSLRHMTTSVLKNAGVSESVAMDIVGHDSEAMSQHYTHIDDGAKRKALRKMPDITKA